MFLHLPELYALSVQLLASLDECIEMAGEVGGVAQSSQAGFVFEEIAEVKYISVWYHFPGQSTLVFIHVQYVHVHCMCIVCTCSHRILMCTSTTQVPMGRLCVYLRIY